MKNSKIILLSAMFASSVATTTVNAEGFFGKLFDSSKDSGAGFTTLLSHVPADTSYLLANKKPYPEEVMAFQLNRGKSMLTMLSDLEKKDAKAKEKGTSGAFFKALFEDFSEKLSKDKIKETGLSLKATSMIYGYNLSPVARLTFADKEKIMATMKRAEEKSGYKIKLEKCGKYDCFTSTDKDTSIALVILEDHIAASFFPKSDKQKMLDHLTGKTSPKESYSVKSWDAFIKDNNYKGFGEGFVNLKKLSVKLKPKIIESIGAKDPKEIENCMAVADEHINNMPEIIFGTKNLDTKKTAYEIVLKSSPDVSTALQTLANSTNIAQRIENPIFDLGININFSKLRDALTQYSNFLIKSGEAHKCKSIKPKEIRKGMGGMMMAMNMGLTQFKSIYASLANIEISDKMDPKKVDAYVSIGTDDPAGLIGMVGMLSPKLMGFQVPTDGSVVKLPDGAIPSKGQPVPDIYLSRSAKSLNIMVGNKKPALKEYKGENPEILSIHLDGKRYYEKLSSVMKMVPKPASSKNQPDEKDVAKMMEQMGSMMGNVDEIIYADKRGLVVRYNIAY